MNKYKRKPTPPGEILLEEFLKPLGVSQTQLAEHIGCDYKVINRIVNNHSSISPDIAIRLGMALHTTPDFWLNAQIAQDIWECQKETPRITPLFRRKPILTSL
jgi:addiction module HigA family antidote